MPVFMTEAVARVHLCVCMMNADSTATDIQTKSTYVGCETATVHNHHRHLLGRPNKVGLKCPSACPYVRPSFRPSIHKKLIRFQWNSVCR